MEISNLIEDPRQRVNLMLIATTLLLMFIVGDNVRTSLQGSELDTQNYEKRKKYYEEVIIPAKLDLHPAKYYIIIDK